VSGHQSTATADREVEPPSRRFRCQRRTIFSVGGRDESHGAGTTPVSFIRSGGCSQSVPESVIVGASASKAVRAESVNSPPFWLCFTLQMAWRSPAHTDTRTLRTQLLSLPLVPTSGLFAL